MAQLMLVDDDPVAAALVMPALSREGHAVRWIDDPREAVPAMRADPPDLVLLDGVMPHLPGVQVAAQMRADLALCRIPLLMLSGRSGARDRFIALRSGADDYLAKPADPDELVFRVENLLSAPRAARRPEDHRPNHECPDLARADPPLMVASVTAT